MRVLWQVECDPYARAVLARRFPAATLYADVRTVGAARLAPVDLLCGGFPCQDISNAGKRAGIDGERSGLWSEYARIIRELRPRYVLVENVAALLARGLERVVGDLAACGYDAEWDCLPAAAFGAPHRRDRLFLVAYAGGERLAQRGQRDGGAEARRQASFGNNACGRGAAYVPDPNRSRLPGTGDAGKAGQSSGGIFAGTTIDRSRGWAVEPDVGRVANGIPARVDRLSCLGNAVVPKIAEWIGRRILAHAGEV